MTDCVSSLPSKVLNYLNEVSSFGWAPFGKAERLTKVLLDLESSRTQRSLRLCIDPIISAIQIVIEELNLDNL